MLPALLIPLASADWNPGTVPRFWNWVGEVQRTADQVLLILYHPALTPASGMISTVRDLEQFDLAMKRGVLLRPEWRALAWTPPTDANGQPLPHAYGWFTQNYNGGRVAWHHGVSDNASSSMIITLPQRGITLILLANSPGLVRPFDLSWRPADTYWIACPKATAKVAKIGRFRDWLLAEAADDARRLGEAERRRR